MITSRFQGMYWHAHKTATLTSFQRSVPPPPDFKPYYGHAYNLANNVLPYDVIIIFFLSHTKDTSQLSTLLSGK